MARRKIRFELGEIKIAGVKLEIDDDLEPATAAFGAAQQLIAGAIQPALSQALVNAQGKTIEGSVPKSHNGDAAHLPAPAARPGRSRSRAKAVAVESANLPTLIHDPVKYGNPKQDWTTAQKAIWILWIVQESTGRSELTATEVVETFNKYFKEFRTINRQNTARDLGKERKKNPPTVGWNPDTKVWYLYDAGKVVARGLAQLVAGEPEQ